MGSVMSSCPPYRVREVAGKGRGLVATRQIQPGEIILEERPLLLLSGEPLEISGETRARILTRHDPADNFPELISEGVDVARLMAQNKNLAVLEEDDETDKIRRIIYCNGVCLVNTSEHDNPLLQYYSKVGAVYHDISFINHSCNPNVTWTWVRDDVERKQVIAMKVIEKDEEILVNYKDEEELNYGSRQFRRQFLLEKLGFLCRCSECSLEGAALLENERIRKMIRRKNMKIAALLREYCPRKLLRAAKLRHDTVDLVKQLDLQREIPKQLLKSYDLLHASLPGCLSEVPDLEIIRFVALESCDKFGDTLREFYNMILRKRDF